MKFRMAYKLLGLFAAALLLAGGCGTTGLPETQHVEPYRPQAVVQAPLNLAGSQNAPTTVQLEVQERQHPSVAINPGIGRDTSQHVMAPVKTRPGAVVDKKPAAVVTGVAVKPAVPEVDPPRTHNVLRKLRSGDKVMIALRGIPHESDINDVIDGWGEVTLPYIGEIKIIDKTLSEAERLIEKSYIDGGIYRRINVIVVAESESYFVRGEVERKGKFELSGKVTLMQAITSAGGFGPFAKRSKIKIKRGDQVLMFNGKDIASGKIPDPQIMANDIIDVQRRRVF